MDGVMFELRFEDWFRENYPGVILDSNTGRVARAAFTAGCAGTRQQIRDRIDELESALREGILHSDEGGV